ncbi:MAG: HEAT repeat domain-containing protein [Planctomycetes bacterium]|nr:HEAT repeat domain-containing protein [Planctomycetota bacterium]
MASASPFSKRPLSAWVEDLQQAPSPDDRYRALLAVICLGTGAEAVRWCCHALKDADSGVRALAAKQMGECRRRADVLKAGETEAWDRVGDLLAVCLQDADPDVRFEAARSLGTVRPQLSDANAVLLSLLDDEGTQPLMTAIVVTALAERPDKSAADLIPRFQKLLQHSQAEIRENVTAAIAHSKPIAAALVSELTAALEDDEPLVRENAAISLGVSGIESPTALEALLTAEQDEDEGVADAARAAYSRLTGDTGS